MVSMDLTLMHSKISFVDHIPQLLRDKVILEFISHFEEQQIQFEIRLELGKVIPGPGPKMTGPAHD